MLVLTRRLDETIVIDGDIRITIVAVHGNRVRIGVQAPKHISVDRLEIHQQRSELVGTVNSTSVAP